MLPVSHTDSPVRRQHRERKGAGLGEVRMQSLLAAPIDFNHYTFNKFVAQLIVQIFNLIVNLL